jgi:NADPH:quinone reductase
MRAMQLQSLDGPDALELVEIPAPVPASDEVLIAVQAAGVSFVDLLMSRGQYQEKLAPPETPGVEVAGTVLQAPDDAGVAVGDAVVAYMLKGGFAAQAVAAASLTYPLPLGFDMTQGAAYILNYQTAYFGLLRRGRLRADETVLVHGAAGGLGSALVQVAQGAGARVIALVRSEAKARIARAAGAQDVLVAGEDWLAAVKARAPEGVDLVADPVGGDLAVDTVRVLRPEGRYLVLGFAAGGIPAVPFNRLLLRNIDVVGAGWGAFQRNDNTMTGESDRGLRAMVDAGHVRPLVGRTYPLTKARQALVDLDEGRAAGKLVLEL